MSKNYRNKTSKCKGRGRKPKQTGASQRPKTTPTTAHNDRTSTAQQPSSYEYDEVEVDLTAFSLEDIVAEVFDKLQCEIDNVDNYTKACYDDSFIDLEEAARFARHKRQQQAEEESTRQQARAATAAAVEVALQKARGAAAEAAAKTALQKARAAVTVAVEKAKQEAEAGAVATRYQAAIPIGQRTQQYHSTSNMSNPSKELRVQHKSKMPRYSKANEPGPYCQGALQKSQESGGYSKSSSEENIEQDKVSKQLKMESNNKGCWKTKGADGSRIATDTAWKTTMQQTKEEWPNYMANNTNKTKITMLNEKWKEKQTTIKLIQNESKGKIKIAKMDQPTRPPPERDRRRYKLKGCRPTMEILHHKHTIERVC